MDFLRFWVGRIHLVVYNVIKIATNYDLIFRIMLDLMHNSFVEGFLTDNGGINIYYNKRLVVEGG